MTIAFKAKKSLSYVLETQIDLCYVKLHCKLNTNFPCQAYMELEALKILLLHTSEGVRTSPICVLYVGKLAEICITPKIIWRQNIFLQNRDTIVNFVERLTNLRVHSPVTSHLCIEISEY